MTKYRILKFKNDFGYDRYNVEYRMFIYFGPWLFLDGYFKTKEEAIRFLDGYKNPQPKNVVYEE